MDQRVADFFEKLDDMDAYWHKFAWMDLREEDPELYNKVYSEYRKQEDE
jgi:hypothetical protein|tara:strand:+ start:259 stop:405 length:147 start_codon:yes stop_codon:yes gene_type:complete